MKIGDRIRILRLKNKLSQEEVGKKLNISKQAVYKYEKDIIDEIPLSKIKLLAEIFNVSPAYLTGWEQPEPSSQKSVKIPVLENIAAGIPVESNENISGYEEISSELASTGTFFALKIKDNSMTPQIQADDTVIVRQQSTAKSGDIVIAKVNSDEACCKKLVANYQGIILQSSNISYKPMFFTREEILTRSVTIIGKVVELRRKI